MEWVCRENEDPPAAEAFLVLMDHLDPRVRVEIQVRRAALARKVVKEILDHRACQADRGSEVQLVSLVLQEKQADQALGDHPELMASLVIRGRRAFKVFQDPWDHQDLLDKWVKLVRMVTLVTPALLGPEVTQARTATKAPLDHPALQEVPEREDRLVLPVHVASKVFLVHQVLLGLVARMEKLVCRVHGVFLALWVLVVTEDSRENVGPKVPQEKVASVESLDRRVLMAHRGLQGLRDRRDILDHLAWWVCLEVVVPLVCQEKKVSVAPLVLLALKVPPAVRVTRVLKE